MTWTFFTGQSREAFRRQLPLDDATWARGRGWASVISRASDYAADDLRTLDAIHLATAEHIVSVTNDVLEAFVAYDERLLAAASDAGLPVAAPGLI
jgi:hypothetical protein